MKTIRYPALWLLCAAASIALPAQAADRIRAGQWDGTWTGGGRTRVTSQCISQADADAINGDVKTTRAYLETVVPPSICKISDIKLNGSQVVYTTLCTGAKENVITTNYHGDAFETVDSSGNKSVAKRTGACK